MITAGVDVILKSKGYTNGRKGTVTMVTDTHARVLWLLDKNNNHLRHRGGLYTIVKIEKLELDNKEDIFSKQVIK
jgi:hypothetical protein